MYSSLLTDFVLLQEVQFFFVFLWVEPENIDFYLLMTKLYNPYISYITIGGTEYGTEKYQVDWFEKDVFVMVTFAVNHVVTQNVLFIK